MKELWLTYVDQDGSDRRVAVDKDEFIIGRHTDADLCYPDDRLSREHVRIERVDDEFVAADGGSTNGTRLNGEDLFEPTALRNGDKLTLGDRLNLSVELVKQEVALSETSMDEQTVESGADPAPPELAINAVPLQAAPDASEPSFPAGIFMAAAIFGVVVIALLGVLIYVFASGDETKSERNDVVYKNDHNDDAPVRNTKTEPTPSSGNNNSNVMAVNDTPSNSPASNVSTKDLSETAKTEQNAAQFLRKIAFNDPKAFLTSVQARSVGSKIKQISSSAALAENISAARKNSGQIKELATAKSLQPQFLAAAAIARLGTSRGDVLKTAREMADVFGKIRTPIGNELSDDALLMVAAYQQGSNGGVTQMINMLQKVVNEYPETPHSVRTIWFLHEKGKISDPEYDFALTFLAVGTILQNPKDFSVNCEALSL